MGDQWIDVGNMTFTEREAKPDEAAGRFVADLTEAVGLEHSRVRLWRYPAHTTGRRHRGHAQVFIYGSPPLVEGADMLDDVELPGQAS